jgi:uncharacterized protein YjbI with pentapeptide repeats
MNPEKLQEILANSKKYWETDGQEGAIVDLTRANLTGADLTGADLRGADFASAVLAGADLRGADLTGANLRDADLRNAVLREAVLRGADLAGAVLRGADFREADLAGADLRGADLRGADLAGAKGLTGDSFGITPDPTLPQRVAKSIIQEQLIVLEMIDWHTCETTHCLAGSAIHLSGPAGYALEKATSPGVAGAMLMPSACHLFLASNEEAMEWLKAQLELPIAN